MKKIGSMLLVVSMVLAIANCTAFAAPSRTVVGMSTGTNITVGASGQDITMEGYVDQSAIDIISVTVPSNIPFILSKGITTQNKVISPSVPVTNNSLKAISVYVSNNRVDLDGMPGARWATSASVANNEIAIGFQKEVTPNQLPASLTGTIWLAEGPQETTLASLASSERQTLNVVGTLGNDIPENVRFTVVPTLVVKAQ